MKNTLMTITLSGFAITGIAKADLLVEFSLHTSTDWDDTNKAYDISMQIDHDDLMGFMPFGTNAYNMTMEVTGFLPGSWQGYTFTYDGVVTGSNTTFDDGGWGDIGFFIPDSDSVFDVFFPGSNNMSLSWGLIDFDPEDIDFSYGMGVWTGGLADAVLADSLYINTNTLNEIVIPAPAALGLLGVTALAGRRRRR